MAEEATVQPVRGRARLRSSTTILLVGNIEPTIAWYKGFIKNTVRAEKCPGARQGIL
jgi:hypothetical protein